MMERDRAGLTFGIGTSAPAPSPRSSNMFTMSMDRSATWRSDLRSVAIAVQYAPAGWGCTYRQ